MPIVPTYGPRRVTTAPLPGVRKQAHETALSEGAGLAAAQAQRSEAMGNFGAVAANVGAHLWEQETRRADEVAMLEAQNKLAKWENDRIYNPETGALTVKGKDAMPLAGQIGQEFDQVAGEIEQGLTNPRQRQAFARIKSEKAISLDATLKRHTFGEMQRYEGQELQALVENAQTTAVANANDPRRVGEELTRAVSAIKTHAPRLGLGPEQVQEQVTKIQTATHEGVINRLLVEDKSKAAQAYFAEAKDAGQITGDAIVRIEKALDTAGTAKTGLDTAGELWQQLGPKGDTDPINLDAMEDAARTKFADDPKALDATIKYLRERKAGVDASRQDRLEQRAGSLWTSASQGASLSDITRTPEYFALPGKMQAQLTDYVVGRAEREANRKYAEEGRAYTERQRLEATREQRGWTRYWELSQPATLDKLTENGLNMMRGELGDQHVNRLLEHKRRLGASEDKVRAATIDDDLFKTVAQSAGLKAYGASSDDDKAELGQLKNAVETEIDLAQQRTNRVLTRDEKQTIMRSIVDRKVMLSSWFTDPEKVAATITNPDDRARAYVPIAKIPPVTISQFINYARGLAPELQRMPEPELRARFGDRIQRAYALRLLGGTRAEIEAAMKGQ